MEALGVKGVSCAGGKKSCATAIGLATCLSNPRE